MMLDPTVISALTALAAVLLGPLVSVYSVRRQTAASTISANRQSWINTLRDTVSEFITQASFIHVAGASGIPPKLEMLTRREKTLLLLTKITLLTNPAEQDHVRLVQLLNSVQELALSATNDNPQVDQYHAARNQLIPLLQSILKREWERVKAFQ